MINFRLSVGTAILILVAIQMVMLGYLNSRIAYNSNIAETDLRQTKLLVNQTFHLMNESDHIVAGTRVLLANQLLVILKQLNATSAADLNHTVTIHKAFEELHESLNAEQKQQPTLNRTH